jgi:hypothetical protein
MDTAILGGFYVYFIEILIFELKKVNFYQSQ